MANVTQAHDQIIRPAVNLGPYIGAILIGSFVALALWGVACVQTLQFFLRRHLAPKVTGHMGDGMRHRNQVPHNNWSLQNHHKR
ncbi:hypothetical protein EST38_g9329 [Candolleomyces aberdarensis]|uniref:Uncharacterized protein n=1 Tax=Candolleomyces aberdarensis TaxID=2316362 RepID=A0A4Q2DBY8_9AGAR|nr:hypothetical protein EST38_g9329 [Candolleomyces aberdarensis]